MRKDDLTYCYEHPISNGWWWCLPDKLCFWHRHHPEGCVVLVTLDQDDFSESGRDDYAMAALSEELISLDPQDQHGLFGSWHGPIESPGGVPHCLIIEAEFEVIDDQSRS